VSVHVPVVVQHAPVGQGPEQEVPKPCQKPGHPPAPVPGKVRVQALVVLSQHAPVQGLGEQEVPPPRHSDVPAPM